MHHTREQMWQRAKGGTQECTGTETKKGNKWQHAWNFNTWFTVVLEILTCLSLIPGPTHLPCITSTFSISLIHHEVIFHQHRSQTSRRQSWNTVWTTIRLTPKLKSPQYEGTSVSPMYVLHILCVSCKLCNSNFSLSFIQPVMPMKFYLKKLLLIPLCNKSEKDIASRIKVETKHSNTDQTIFNFEKLNIQTQWTSATPLLQYSSCDNLKHNLNVGSWQQSYDVMLCYLVLAFVWRDMTMHRR